MLIYGCSTYVSGVEDELVFEFASDGFQHLGRLGYHLGSDAVPGQDGDIVFHQRLLCAAILRLVYSISPPASISSSMNSG